MAEREGFETWILEAHIADILQAWLPAVALHHPALFQQRDLDPEFWKEKFGVVREQFEHDGESLIPKLSRFPEA